ncbi:E3 ubiquitin-protein ligase ubr-1 [Thelohanellus kitauei]|uniref:E3 ubiquitin-protein ligase n=1 Tax=Thelohanellus kitauei TaxID=669202 RepID=A0A0C2J1E5_THEKT|nr:E3 ubiquitin-protein ligase ubr-1 [Thelohanellus kitauei]
MEEVRRRIDNIIINGLLVTSNDTGADANKIYSNDKLETLVGVPLEEYIFEGFDPEIKQWFDSDEGNLETCTKIIGEGEPVFMCIDCQRHDLCCLCEYCFLHSEHKNHDYQFMEASFSGHICGCGVKIFWRHHSACTRHKKKDKWEVGLPEIFMDRFGCIIKYLCELLEKICTVDTLVLDSHMEQIIDTYIQPKNSQDQQNMDQKSEQKYITTLNDANARKSCLIVLNDGFHPLECYIDCFMSLLQMSLEDSMALSKEIASLGYTCVQYNTDSDKCKETQVNIETCPRFIVFGELIKCRIIKVYRFYFMKIAVILTRVIHEYCWKKTKLCDLLSEVIFKQTSFACTYVVNEHALWKQLRFEIVNGIFLLTTFSEIGKRGMTSLFLDNIRGLYSRSLQDHHKTPDCFLSLTPRFTMHSHLVMYLVENGFLSKSLDVFSDLLKSVGIEGGVDVTQLKIQSTSARIKLMQVLHTNYSLVECLRVSLNDCEWSPQFRSQLSEAGKRLVQFCFDFDDIQPLRIVIGSKIDKASFQYLLSLVGAIYEVLCRMVMWLVYYDKAAVATLESFLERFTMVLKRISEENPTVPIRQKIIAYCNVETDRFSIFNLSHRVFVDIFMDCCLKGTLPCEIRDKVFGDETMLMWISRPAVTALSFTANFNSREYCKDLKHLDRLFGIYFKSNLIHYLYMQDFNTIQILIAHIDPDLFLKYLLFNIAPSILNRVDPSHSLSSILSFREFAAGYNLRQLLILVNNALIERHFVGVLEDPEYQLLERQIIHSLASGHFSIKDIANNIFVYRELFISDCRRLKKTLKEILEKVSFTTKSRNKDNENQIFLKPEYVNVINMFFFMLYPPESLETVNMLTYLYNIKEWRFQLPRIVKLKECFKGINSFLFSKAFSDLIMRILVEWYSNLGPNETGAVENLLLVSMIICFMLKESLNQNIDSNFQKVADLIFGIREDLGDKNVMTLFAFFKNKNLHEIFDSIFDHLSELAQFPKNYFDDLSDNPSDMINKSKDCRDLVLKNLRCKYQEILSRSEGPASDNIIQPTD